MTSPILHAFFVGRALAETINEGAERLMTDTLSNLGRFDAEQRESLRQFTEQVIARAQEAELTMGTAVADESSTATMGQDLQATIDTLRAEVAQVRVALQQYRNAAEGEGQ